MPSPPVGHILSQLPILQAFPLRQALQLVQTNTRLRNAFVQNAGAFSERICCELDTMDIALWEMIMRGSTDVNAHPLLHQACGTARRRLARARCGNWSNGAQLVVTFNCAFALQDDGRVIHTRIDCKENCPRARILHNNRQDHFSLIASNCIGWCPFQLPANRRCVCLSDGCMLFDDGTLFTFGNFWTWILSETQQVCANVLSDGRRFIDVKLVHGDHDRRFALGIVDDGSLVSWCNTPGDEYAREVSAINALDGRRCVAIVSVAFEFFAVLLDNGQVVLQRQTLRLANRDDLRHYVARLRLPPAVQNSTWHHPIDFSNAQVFSLRRTNVESAIDWHCTERHYVVQLSFCFRFGFALLSNGQLVFARHEMINGASNNDDIRAINDVLLQYSRRGVASIFCYFNILHVLFADGELESLDIGDSADADEFSPNYYVPLPRF